MDIAIRFILGLIALTLGACASSPVTLVVLPSPMAPASQTAPETSGKLLLRRVSIPAYLDDFPVVTGRTGNMLLVARNVEWGEPLAQGASRVLRDALAQRLGASRVLIKGDNRIPDLELTIEFVSLDPIDHAMHLDARWFFSCRGNGLGRADRTRVQAVMTSGEPHAVANAVTSTLVQLADVLAANAQCEPAPLPIK